MCLCRQAVYKLVPAKGRWCSVADEVTAGMAENNGSLPLGGWLTVTCGLTACTPRSAPGTTLGIEYRKAFTFYSNHTLHFGCVISYCLSVQVFCRVRPLDGDTDAACVKVISVSTVQLSQPEVCWVFKKYILAVPMNTYFLVTLVNSHQRSDIKGATSQSQWSSSLLKKGWGPLSDSTGWHWQGHWATPEFCTSHPSGSSDDCLTQICV